MKYVLIALVYFYKITPINTHSLCRHVPTCSTYMIEALDKYGSLKGLYLGSKRLLKCRPNGTYGYDPLK